ncbi:MAG: hypothetical protein LUH06_03165, partial [Oscillospiraceae bacterium]|nr:hypothetical protein [Oscillospiraceae bacterium]
HAEKAHIVTDFIRYSRDFFQWFHNNLNLPVRISLVLQKPGFPTCGRTSARIGANVGHIVGAA